MGCTIHLDDELRLDAGKIDDEAVDGMLATKFAAIQFALAQNVPKLFFRGGLICAQLPRPDDRLSHRWISPLTRAFGATSPRRGEVRRLSS
ncbi:hypothetical protein CHELA1G2_10320 [Hyphomicrobiales bacterium]|nr:hypothetical protein CHELA1G2_10320 [Hyphomicrobiales bacterium]